MGATPIFALDNTQKNLILAAATGQGAGNTFAVPGHPSGGRYSNFTWQTTYTGSPSTVSISIQGSDDTANWVTIATATNPAGELDFVANFPFTFIRAYVTTLSDGTRPTVSVTVVLGR